MKVKLNKKSVSINLNFQEFGNLVDILDQWLEVYHEEDCEYSEFIEKHQSQLEKVDKYINKCVSKNINPYPQIINFVKKGQSNAEEFNAIIEGFSK